jgi:branched-chain amino acid transport system ATP-binding protein
MLELKHVDSGYGRAQVLFGLDLKLGSGEVLALLGRNGAGKSTTLKATMGLLKTSSGHIGFANHSIQNLPPHEIARFGLGYVPEDRRIFSGLSVMENLETGRQPPREGVPRWSADKLFELFPNLGRMRERRGASMSGGEQQMLAIARTLMGNPRAVLLDEPFEGLAPVIVSGVAAAIRELRREGLSVLLCEQNLRFARMVADRACVIEKGRLCYDGSLAALETDAALRERYLAL